MNISTKVNPTLPVAPFRPIQYLGNKLRVLDPIVDMAVELVGSKGRIADLFTGSSVVAQALCSKGFSVTAVDTQSYSVAIASAMLGVGRSECEVFDPLMVLQARYSPPSFEQWSRYAEAERNAIAQNDFGSLIKLYSELPLIWRRAAHWQVGNVISGDVPLMTEIYSGSYFGVGQALALDQLRSSAAALHQSGQLTDWQFSAALTAILSAASAAVNSAGKHFAQPLLAGSSQNIRFLQKRVLEDRRICINRQFIAASAEINLRAQMSFTGNNAVKSAAEDFVAGGGSDFDLYYLDPPYTAQQYSRFYHVLETLTDYKVPDLIHNGKVTTGLYPTSRYKSAFSSRRFALSAFSGILEQAKRKNVSVLISYSASSENSTGNARMISLNELLEACRGVFGDRAVQKIQMNHRYRQFNSTENANAQRDDPEMLIACRIS